MTVRLIMVVVLALGWGGPVMAIAQTPSATIRYVSESENFAFTLPENWFVAEDAGLMVVGTSEDAVNQEQFEPGTLGGFVFHPNLTAILLPDEIALDAAPLVFLEALNETAPSDTAYSETTSLDIEGWPAAYVTSTSGFSDLIALVVQLDANFRTLIVLGTAPGDGDAATAQALAIAQSIGFTAPTLAESDTAPAPPPGIALPLTETFQSPTFNLTFQYPVNWVTVDGGNLVAVNNAEVVLTQNGNYLPNAVQVVIFPAVERAQLMQAFGMQGRAFTDGILNTYVQDVVLSTIEDGQSSPPQVLDWTELTVYRQRASSEQGDGLYYLIEHPNGLLTLVAAATAPDTMAQFAATVEAIVDSIRWEG